MRSNHSTLLVWHTSSAREQTDRRSVVLIKRAVDLNERPIPSKYFPLAQHLVFLALYRLRGSLEKRPEAIDFKTDTLSSVIGSMHLTRYNTVTNPDILEQALHSSRKAFKICPPDHHKKAWILLKERSD